MSPLLTGLICLAFLAGFFFYAAVNIKHAARFRYLGKRTVYLTVAFIALSAALLITGAILYGAILFN
jgi:hypothetical protein